MRGLTQNRLQETDLDFRILSHTAHAVNNNPTDPAVTNHVIGSEF